MIKTNKITYWLFSRSVLKGSYDKYSVDLSIFGNRNWLKSLVLQTTQFAPYSKTNAKVTQFEWLQHLVLGEKSNQASHNTHAQVLTHKKPVFFLLLFSCLFCRPGGWLELISDSLMLTNGCPSHYPSRQSVNCDGFSHTHAGTPGGTYFPPFVQTSATFPSSPCIWGFFPSDDDRPTEPTLLAT